MKFIAIVFVSVGAAVGAIVTLYSQGYICEQDEKDLNRFRGVYHDFCLEHGAVYQETLGWYGCELNGETLDIIDEVSEFVFYN